MDNRTIQLETALTTSDYIRASRHMQFTSISFIIIAILSAVSFCISIIYLLYSDLSQAAMFLILPVVFTLVFFIIMPNRIKLYYRRSRKLQDKIRWNIDMNGFTLETRDISEKYAWDEFQSVKKNKGLYLIILKVSKKAAKIIPARAFNNADELSFFEEILEVNKLLRRKR